MLFKTIQKTLPNGGVIFDHEDLIGLRRWGNYSIETETFDSIPSRLSSLVDYTIRKDSEYYPKGRGRMALSGL